MDNRIAEVERLIADCNARTLAQRQLAAESEKNWGVILGAIQKIQKAAVDTNPEKKNGGMPMQEPLKAEGKAASAQVRPEPIFARTCARCGEPMRAGVNFCRFCGTRVEASINTAPQPVPVDLCICGQRFVPGANFCRNCGRPVNQRT